MAILRLITIVLTSALCKELLSTITKKSFFGRDVIFFGVLKNIFDCRHINPSEHSGAANVGLTS